MGSSFQADVALGESARLNSDQVNYLIWRYVAVSIVMIRRGGADGDPDICRSQASERPLGVGRDLLTRAQVMEKRR